MEQLDAYQIIPKCVVCAQGALPTYSAKPKRPATGSCKSRYPNYPVVGLPVHDVDVMLTKIAKVSDDVPTVTGERHLDNILWTVTATRHGFTHSVTDESLKSALYVWYNQYSGTLHAGDEGKRWVSAKSAWFCWAEKD